MKLSDYVMEFLAQRGVRNVFMVSGGGIMHLTESCGRRADLRYWCNYHEQASAICAESHAKLTGELGVCLVTQGPGAANAISGLLGAWMDSAPVLCLAGQVRTSILADHARIRQYGPQEGNNLELARSVTKYSTRISDASTIRYELEKAVHLATSGRPGPVFVEIPLDIQAAEIDPQTLTGYAVPTAPAAGIPLEDQVAIVLAELRKAQRPILVLGNGIRWAGAYDLVEPLLARTRLPAVMPFSAKDILAESHPANMGIIGTSGQRRANFAVQSSDCLLSIGSGLAITKVGFNFDRFAPAARKIFVDIDPGQLHDQAVKPDIAVEADAGDFLSLLLSRIGQAEVFGAPRWHAACKTWRERYPILEAARPAEHEPANSYHFMDALSSLMSARDILVTGNGLDCVSYWQTFKIKPGQRSMLSGNWGAMGWDLPTAIGACVGGEMRQTICVTGDGSIQWNIQELMLMGLHALPIKIFVFNNQGYSAIRATQKAFFNGHFVGADQASGVANPDFGHLAAAYRLSYKRIGSSAEVEAGILDVLQADGPVLCEVMISPQQWISPKASAFRRADGTLESRPIEDMEPFLPRDEIWENMHQFDEN